MYAFSGGFRYAFAQAQQIPTPPDADAAADADIRADLSDDLERARRDSTLALQQNAHLDQALVRNLSPLLHKETISVCVQKALTGTGNLRGR